jgi:tetratricopeptide (TPR) repeat protein
MRSIEPVLAINRAYYHNNLAQTHAYLGNYELALEEAAKAVELLPVAKDHLFGATQRRVQVLVLGLAGRHEEAIDGLAETLDQIEGHTSWELALDPTWDFLRGNERFDALIAGKQIRENRP